MLTFSTLLREAGIDPAEVLLIRHTSKDPKFSQILPWLVVERPDLFLAWERIQWQPAEKAMTRARYAAALIGQESGTATLAGLFAIKGWEVLPADAYWDFPGNAELGALGLSSGPQAGRDMLAFNLDPVVEFDRFIGRLVIGWPPGQSWARWAGSSSYPIRSISDESQFVSAMPHWRDIRLEWAELGALPRSWRAALTQWRGVYYIYDVARAAGYVGSAYGVDNLYGRWTGYAATGHGGNKRLRESRPENLRFSILELTAPSADPTDVIALEGNWKQRLSTREFGLNEN
jgi:hypothetical protein